jgi:hypothetical protein
MQEAVAPRYLGPRDVVTVDLTAHTKPDRHTVAVASLCDGPAWSGALAR